MLNQQNSSMADAGILRHPDFSLADPQNTSFVEPDKVQLLPIPVIDSDWHRRGTPEHDGAVSVGHVGGLAGHTLTPRIRGAGGRDAAEDPADAGGEEADRLKSIQPRTDEAATYVIIPSTQATIDSADTRLSHDGLAHPQNLSSQSGSSQMLKSRSKGRSCNLPVLAGVFVLLFLLLCIAVTALVLNIRKKSILQEKYESMPKAPGPEDFESTEDLFTSTSTPLESSTINGFTSRRSASIVHTSTSAPEGTDTIMCREITYTDCSRVPHESNYTCTSPGYRFKKLPGAAKDCLSRRGVIGFLSNIDFESACAFCIRSKTTVEKLESADANECFLRIPGSFSSTGKQCR